MPDQPNKDVLIEQLRDHVKHLIKQLTSIATLWSAVILSLVGGYHVVEIFSVKVNFFYGSVIAYSIVCFKYFLCAESIKKIGAIADSVADESMVRNVLRNEAGFLNPFTPPYIGLILGNTLPYIFVSVIGVYSVPPLLYDYFGGAYEFEFFNVVGLTNLLILIVLLVSMALTYGRYLIHLCIGLEQYVAESVVLIHFFSSVTTLLIMSISSSVFLIFYFS